MFKEFNTYELSCILIFLQLHRLNYYNFDDMTNAIIHELIYRNLHISSTN